MEATLPKKTNVLYFSINKPTFDPLFVQQSLVEFLWRTEGLHPHHPHRAVVIADTIKALSYEVIDRKTPAKARQMCLEAGDRIVGHVKQFCAENNVEIQIFRWDDLIKDPNYRDCYERATRELLVKPLLRENLINLTMKFLKNRDSTRYWRPKDIEVSLDFFVQEIASFRKVRFGNVIIDRVFYTPEKMRIGEETYQVLSEVGDGLTGIGELAPHELIRVQCINQDESPSKPDNEAN
jgi:hypothetical protein